MGEVTTGGGSVLSEVAVSCETEGMPKPVTPLVACDVFVLNEKQQVLLIRRTDNGFWALPGGCHDLGETASQCAERECFEESGYRVRVSELLGHYSSMRYPYVNYP